MSTINLTGIWPWMLRFLPGQRAPQFDYRTEPAALVPPRMFRVQIDMDQLRSHVMPLTRGEVSESHLRKWLVQSGFQPVGDWWIVPESGLAQLAPSELTATEPLN